MTPTAAAVIPARAALAGNPSDLHGGAVLAVPVPSLAARVEMARSATTSVDGDPGANALIAAALARTQVGPVQLRWTTTIPRSVGLAGSSAIVLAVLRAAAGLAGSSVEPLALALEGLAVEREDLGMAAGLQDRATQAFAAPVLVDLVAPNVVSPIETAKPIHIAVAWCDGAAMSSDAYHRALAPPDAGAVRALAETARHAANAFASGDAAGLARWMGESAALRTRVAPLPPAHEALAAAVRGAGLVATSAGSGGAIATVVSDPTAEKRLVDAVARFGGGVVVETFGP